MQEPGTDSITKFYDGVALLELEGAKKSEVAIRIIDDVTVKGDYWIQMILSAVIAAL